MSPIALLYDDDAYVEPPPGVSAWPDGERPGVRGLMGRQVAGREFLDAYLSHGDWNQVVGLVRRQGALESLAKFCREHPSSQNRARRLRVVEEQRFHDDFFPNPPARQIYTPCPPDSKYVWARQAGGPDAYAVSGVTHTLCSLEATHFLNTLIIAPFEPYDAVICTSRAVESMVRAVTGALADDLRSRCGGTPGVRARLEVIPLGVNTERFRPPSPAERNERRRALGIDDDEVVVLFVGRLSHHAKAHPFPMFRGASLAAEATGRRVRLLMSGWAAHPAVREAFGEGAAELAQGVRVDFLDGTAADTRFAVWKAADIFCSLSDNIQETFGLVVVEAMATGLPVIASDWDGYRDLVVPGQTGFLVPTAMVPGATEATTSRLLFGEVDYDHFLAECSQAVAVDVAETAGALAALIRDPDLRHRMGAEGRIRAVERFAWPRIIRAYEALWTWQETERVARASARTAFRAPLASPACYPAPERSFAGYPTRWLRDDHRLKASEHSHTALDTLLALRLTHHGGDRRSSDPAILRAVLTSASSPRSLTDLDAVLQQAGISRRAGRATIAWMLKYDLLRVSHG